MKKKQTSLYPTASLCQWCRRTGGGKTLQIEISQTNFQKTHHNKNSNASKKRYSKRKESGASLSSPLLTK